MSSVAVSRVLGESLADSSDSLSNFLIRNESNELDELDELDELNESMY